MMQSNQLHVCTVFFPPARFSLHLLKSTLSFWKNARESNSYIKHISSFCIENTANVKTKQIFEISHLGLTSNLLDENPTIISSNMSSQAAIPKIVLNQN